MFEVLSKNEPITPDVLRCVKNLVPFSVLPRIAEPNLARVRLMQSQRYVIRDGRAKSPTRGACRVELEHTLKDVRG